MNSATLTIGGKLTLETKLQLQKMMEAVLTPENWGYLASQRIDAAIHDGVPLVLDGLPAPTPIPAALGHFLTDAHLQFTLVNSEAALVYGPWTASADFLSEVPPEEWETVKLYVTEYGEPLLDAKLAAKILEHAGSPYHYEGALLQFFRKVLQVPPLQLVV